MLFFFLIFMFVEGQDAPCPVLASYILHNSLAYGADWSRLPLSNSTPPSPLEPPQTSVGLTGSGGHLRIQYESPTASFDTSLEDDSGRCIPDQCPLPERSSVPDPVTGPARDSQSLSCLMATCSFYDHMMHVWRWDWSPEDKPKPPEPAPSSWTQLILWALKTF